MRSTNPGRAAGFLYLLLVIAGPLRLLYIPSTLFVQGNASATADNISSHQMLFRLGMAADVFCGAILIFILLALYHLLKEVDRKQAVLMVILGGVLPSAIYFFNVVNDAAVLILLNGANFLSVFEKPQREALAMLFLRLHGQEVVAAETLWGLWLFPLGSLVYRSRFLPCFLGVWLILNGVAYLSLSFTGLLFPHYEDVLSKFTFPIQLGEIAFVLWLLIKGARPNQVPSQAT